MCPIPNGFRGRAISLYSSQRISDFPGGKVNILGGHSIGHSKQKYVYVHVSYTEWFPR
jgi:hypothetical protein